MTTFCLVERVIPASADPGRNTSLHDVRTFSGVRRSNAACTFSYINVPPRFSLLRAADTFLSYVCLSYARVGAMFCVTMPTWPCEEYVLSQARARARARLRCHTRQPRLCVVCVLTSGLAGEIRENVYLPHYNDIASRNIRLRTRRRIGFRNSRKRYLNFRVSDAHPVEETAKRKIYPYVCEDLPF